MGNKISVEVVYALPERQELTEIQVDNGTTALEAVKLSGLQDKFPEMEIDEKSIGVFSRKVTPDYVLKPGDRVEIYRPLLADPKESRRRRAKADS